MMNRTFGFRRGEALSAADAMEARPTSTASAPALPERLMNCLREIVFLVMSLPLYLFHSINLINSSANPAFPKFYPAEACIKRAVLAGAISRSTARLAMGAHPVSCTPERLLLEA